MFKDLNTHAVSYTHLDVYKRQPLQMMVLNFKLLGYSDVYYDRKVFVMNKFVDKTNCLQVPFLFITFISNYDR